LNFGNVLVGSSAQLTLTITNDGNSALTISNITYPTGFSGDFSAGTIATGSTTNVIVTFSPTDTITYSGSVTVDSDATSGANTVTASGTGINPPPVAPIISLSGDLDFGDVEVGSSAQLTLTISNAGTSTLTISNITYPNGFSGAFAGAIETGATTNVTVTFSPDASTDFGGTVTVVSDAISGANTITVSGTGFDYFPAKTRFSGLFYPSNNIAIDNSGYFRASTSAKKGTFSAKIQIAGKHYSVSGRFSPGGSFSGPVARKGLTPLTITIQAGFDGGDVWKGTISDGVWTADLIANRSTFKKKTNPAPQAGTYTLTIAGSGDVLVAPTANGSGTVVITSTGALKFTGTLGDGAKVTQVTAISKDGEWPFFGSLYSGRGSIIGWLTISGNDISGPVNWFKLPSVDPVNYPSGFSFQTTATGAKN
jgi:hypothetical protein